MLTDREYFNKRAKDWDKECIHDVNKVRHIIDLIEINPSNHVLDVGTGTGVLIPHIIQSLSENGHVVGVDISENMLEIAKQKWNNHQVTYHHGDVLELNWNKKFDTIICYSMFPHFKENKMNAINRLSHLLNKGGKLCIAHSQSRDDINRLHLKAGEEVENDRLPEMNIMKTMFITNGINPVKVIDNESFYVIIGIKQN